jgi:CHASE3 domain sensor protein
MIGEGQGTHQEKSQSQAFKKRRVVIVVCCYVVVVVVVAVSVDKALLPITGWYKRR